MLKSQLLHPQILEALGRAGHSSKVLIADGNYPFATRLGPRAQLVSLNLSPGVVSGAQALAALVSAVPIEAAAVMQYATTGPYALAGDPPIWEDYARILRSGGFAGTVERIERFEFYQAAGTADVVLTIATAEQRIFANLLLTIGVVTA
jgi:L-fucose mutarotase